MFWLIVQSVKQLIAVRTVASMNYESDYAVYEVVLIGRYLATKVK